MAHGSIQLPDDPSPEEGQEEMGAEVEEATEALVPDEVVKPPVAEEIVDAPVSPQVATDTQVAKVAPKSDEGTTMRPGAKAEISEAQARVLEIEASLVKGAVARNRELTAAEQLYFALPDCKQIGLALHVGRLAGKTTLVVFDLDLGDPKAKEKPYLHGGPVGDGADRSKILSEHWGALILFKGQGLKETINQGLTVLFTSWDAVNPGLRYSWALAPTEILGLYMDASRAVLTSPTFVDAPPPPGPDEKPTGPSQGLQIGALGVESVIFAHSINFMGTDLLNKYDARGLLELVAQERGRVSSELVAPQARP